jgi:hypothetical protein
MRLNSVDSRPFFRLRYLNAARGGGTEVRQLCFERGTVDRLPDGVRALIATADLQGVVADPDTNESTLLGVAVVQALEALALENAVEGCVRETFGALCGAYQAARAADPVVRTTLAQITRDETTHALLSWQIAAWAEPRLDRAALRRVREARRAAIRELRDEAAVAPEPELCATLGVPDAARATALLGALDQGLWREVG